MEQKPQLALAFEVPEDEREEFPPATRSYNASFIGREPTETQRELVLMLASNGTTLGVIAKVMKCSKPTLRKHFRAQLDEAFERIRVVRKHEALDGGTLLPGFRLPLAQLFEEEGAQA